MALTSRIDARAFHPDLRTVSRVLPTRLVSRRTLGLVRRTDAWLPADRAFEEHRVSSTASVQVYRPEGARPSAPAVLWIHGGGLVIGSPAIDHATTRRLADELGATVALVRYRRAPEHRAPAALDDCYAALEWLAGQPYVGRLAVAGVSAGGGLAAATALAARDRGGPRLALQALVYPMLDDRTAARPDADAEHRRVWDVTADRFGWASYLGSEPGGSPVPPYAVPARAGDLRDLPPAWLGVGTLDLFHDEDLAYAARLRAAGVEARTLVVPGAFHGFDAVAPRSGVARHFHRELTAALRAALQD